MFCYYVLWSSLERKVFTIVVFKSSEQSILLNVCTGQSSPFWALGSFIRVCIARGCTAFRILWDYHWERVGTVCGNYDLTLVLKVFQMFLECQSSLPCFKQWDGKGEQKGCFLALKVSWKLNQHSHPHLLVFNLVPRACLIVREGGKYMVPAGNQYSDNLKDKESIDVVGIYNFCLPLLKWKDVSFMHVAWNSQVDTGETGNTGPDLEHHSRGRTSWPSKGQHKVRKMYVWNTKVVLGSINGNVGGQFPRVHMEL